MIAGQCLAAAALVHGASLLVGPRLVGAEAWPFVAAVAAAASFLAPLPLGRRRRGATARAVGAALAVWLPWVVPAGAPLSAVVPAGLVLALATGLASSAKPTSWGLLLALVVGLALAGPTRWIGGGPGGDGAAGGARAGWRIAEVPVTLTGPLDRATLGYEGYPHLEVHALLRDGETVTSRAWMVTPEDSDVVDPGPPPVIGFRPSMGAVVADVPLPRTGTPVGTLRSLPPPPPGAMTGLPLPIPAVLLAWAAALLAAVLVPGRRIEQTFTLIGFAFVALAASVGGLSVTSVESPRDLPEALVLEGSNDGDGAVGWGLATRSIGGLEGPAPTGAAALGVAEVLVPDPLGPARTELVVQDGKARRSVVPRRSVAPVDRGLGSLDLGLRLLRPEVNTLASMVEVWVLDDPSQGWRGLGPWSVGEAAPAGPAAPAAAAPPPWLGSSLPMGRRLLLGRIDPDSPLVERLRMALGEGPKDATRGDVWVRLVGFGE